MTELLGWWDDIQETHYQGIMPYSFNTEIALAPLQSAVIKELAYDVSLPNHPLMYYN